MKKIIICGMLFMVLCTFMKVENVKASERNIQKFSKTMEETITEVKNNEVEEKEEQVVTKTNESYMNGSSRISNITKNKVVFLKILYIIVLIVIMYISIVDDINKVKRVGVKNNSME